ncbi:MAG: hypothetical protein ANABAC_2429 [Anaerolineae bacterium]|nr:MAG: hypothetical protein ANABAC_2429 [Anaerolineae bacterium]
MASNLGLVLSIHSKPLTLVLDGKILLAVVGIGLVAMRIQKGAKG